MKEKLIDKLTKLALAVFVLECVYIYVSVWF